VSVLENTVNQAIADFDSIEAAIKDMGVDVPQGTDTSEYGKYIKRIQNSPIKYVESLDPDNPLILRDFESGTYILYGKFKPNAATSTKYTFSSGQLVSITHGNSSTCVQVFYPPYNAIQYLLIYDDKFERKDARLYYMPTYLTDGSANGSTKSTFAAEAISERSIALGKDSIAGAKAFKIVGFDDTNKTYTLDSAEGLAVGDTYSLVIQNNYDDWGTITAINDKTVTVSDYIADVTTEDAERYFRVPLKPECGTVDFGESAVSLGELCMAVAFAAFSEGYNNKVIGKYGHGEGKNNKVGYAAHAENRDNKAMAVNSHAGGGGNVIDPAAYCAFIHANKGRVSAQCGVGFGESPTVSGTSGFVSGGRANFVSGDCGFTGGGELNSSEGKNSVSTGYMSKACSENQRVHGKHNIKDVNGKYVDIVGNGKSNTERSNAYTLDWNGNAWYLGTVEATAIILKSSTAGSNKKFKITVNDSGTLSATELS